MKDNGYSFQQCSLVMELHFFAMFSPGFISGKLIEKYGSFRIAMVGGFIFAGSSAVFATGGGQTWNYFLGMILLGVAWNFAFSAGTVMLTGCYRVSECISLPIACLFV
jgi:MFS family permease